MLLSKAATEALSVAVGEAGEEGRMAWGKEGRAIEEATRD